MRFRVWAAGLCLAAALAAPAWGQQSDAARANDLYKAGKRLDALPLYEKLAADFPKEWLYQERLADCLAAQSAQLTDPAQLTAIRTRMRDTAKRAIELGDTAEFMHVLANIDPSKPMLDAGASAGGTLLAEAEKAFTAGDYKTAMEKYVAAADADPKLYEAALFAGDTAMIQQDLPTAGKWFSRAIAIDPDRETAYRYWGDAILKLGGDPAQAREKFIDAVVAEPYNRLAWQGIKQWAQIEKAAILAPVINRPAGPSTDSSKPNNINITIDPSATDEKKHPGAGSWMMYSLLRASFQMEEFKKEFPAEKQYRHSLKEEDQALGMVATTLKGDKKLKRDKLDESLRNLLDLDAAGMLDCWILINAPDQGIAQDYDAYRKDHRKLLHDYLARFVVHGGPS